jgi:predicted MFS family arabinose efflux permease
LWALTISIFAIGTTEVVMVGILPDIAKDLSIAIPRAGSLVTWYALGVAVGGPVITALTSTLPRKLLLLLVMVLFIAGNLAAAFAPGYGVLVVARILSGFAHGVFIGIGANLASSLVPPDRRATAIAIMFTGLTVAMVTGVPLGTWIGQRYGWRYTFAGVAALGVIGLAANLSLLPSQLKKGRSVRLADQLKVIRNPSLLLGFSLTVWSFAGVFGTFTYLPVILQEVTRFSSASSSVLLLIYGGFVALGNMIGGRWTNRHPVRTLTRLLAVLAVVLFLLYFAVGSRITAVIALAGMGFFAFSIVPGMQFYVVQLAEKHLPGTEDVSSSLNIAAFNIGIAMGSFAGASIISSSWGIRAVPLLSALFVVAAFFFSIRSRKREMKFSKQDHDGI